MSMLKSLKKCFFFLFVCTMTSCGSLYIVLPPQENNCLLKDECNSSNKWIDAGSTETKFEPNIEHTPKEKEESTDLSTCMPNKLVKEFKHFSDGPDGMRSGSVKGISIFPNKKLLASGYHARGEIRIWDIQSEEIVNEIDAHQKDVISVDVHPSGEYIASGSEDKTVKIFEYPSGKIYVTLGFNYKITSVRFNPDGESIAVSTKGPTIRVWSLKQKKDLFRIERKLFHSPEIRYSSNGKWLTGATSGPIGPYSINLWNARTGELLHPFDGHINPTKHVTIDPFGKWILGSDLSGVMKMWDISQKKLIGEFSAFGHVVENIAVHPMGKYFVSSDDTHVKFWSPLTKNLLHSMKIPDRRQIDELRFSKEGDMMLVGSNFPQIWMCP